MIRDCKIIKELPQGGQKIIHLAEHPKVGTVVIKKGAIKSFTSLERIKREVELLSELKSEYYPHQYHFNIDVKTKEFEIVEDYIEGKVLREIMSQFKTPKEIFTLFNFLVKGLSVIWDKNIVHRDLKPENIIIRPNGMPCIIDLGIARFLDLESLTKTISPMGPCTPIYAAPEQLANNKNLIDPRTDFFDLGIIALELYLGVHPYDPAYVGNHFSIVENIMQNKYIVESGTVKRDDVVVEFANKTLQIQPYDRFRNYQMLTAFIARQI
ncbi:MAG: serine/threonine-protein kinase [Bacteroidota bacterium]